MRVERALRVSDALAVEDCEELPVPVALVLPVREAELLEVRVSDGLAVEEREVL